MSQCKTLANLHRKMAEVYDFCKGTMLEEKEYLCVKYNGDIEHLYPRFNLIPTSYEFAIGIVEDKPVWEGDILYDKHGIPIRVAQQTITSSREIELLGVIKQMREALVALTDICITQVGADYNDAIHAAFLKGKEALALTSDMTEGA